MTDIYTKLKSKYADKITNTKYAELVEIVGKFYFYGKRCKWYLKPFYKIACSISAFIAKTEITRNI